jgi:hypothetical protein
MSGLIFPGLIVPHPIHDEDWWPFETLQDSASGCWRKSLGGLRATNGLPFRQPKPCKLTCCRSCAVWLVQLLIDHGAHVFAPLEAVWIATTADDNHPTRRRLAQRKRREGSVGYVMAEASPASTIVHCFATADLSGTEPPTAADGHWATPQEALDLFAIALTLPRLGKRLPTFSGTWSRAACTFCPTRPPTRDLYVPGLHSDPVWDEAERRAEDQLSRSRGVPVTLRNPPPGLSIGDRFRALRDSVEEVETASGPVTDFPWDDE